jgi:DNA invertase Pin-like site-specific DNA recombinase
VQDFLSSLSVTAAYWLVRRYRRKSEAQQDALRAAGALQVFAEKISGVRRDRPALERLLGSLEPGDAVLVTKLDRLAAIAKAGATFRSLGDPWADSATPHGKLMLTVLGGLAKVERHLILNRTNEGRVQAKARGVKFGRRPKLTRHQQAEALARIAHGETLTAIARSFNVSHMTISRLAGVAVVQ